MSGRGEYARADDIIAELKLWLKNNPQEAKELSYVTLSGLGEPTLSTCIEELIVRSKELTGAKVAVITNSTLLGDPSVRKSILGADLIVPSLDSADEEVFRQIDRPAAGIRLEDIIDGLIALRREFRGQIWLEVMFVSGLNDDIDSVERLRKVIQRINPDRIQLNSPVRSTAEKNVLPVEKVKLETIRSILGSRAEII